MPTTVQQRETYIKHNLNNYCSCPVCRFVRQNNSPTSQTATTSACSKNCLRCALQRKHLPTNRYTVTVPSTTRNNVNRNPVSTKILQRALTAVESTKPILLRKQVKSSVETRSVIDQRLAAVGLQREVTRGDGNCFFHAVASLFKRYALIDDDQNFHAILRQQVCDFVEQHYDDLKMIKEVIECEYTSLENFINVMRQSGTYADGNVANIVSIIYNVNFHIHTHDGVMQTNPAANSPSLHIVWIGDHWEATKPLAIGER